MKITLLYRVSHIGKKQRNIKSWDYQITLLKKIRGFCYIQPLYNKVPLYYMKQHRKMCVCVCTCVCVCVLMY